MTKIPEAERRMKPLCQQVVRGFQSGGFVRDVRRGQAIDSTEICTECVCGVGVFRTYRGTGGVEIDRKQSVGVGLRFG